MICAYSGTVRAKVDPTAALKATRILVEHIASLGWPTVALRTTLGRGSLYSGTRGYVWHLQDGTGAPSSLSKLPASLKLDPASWYVVGEKAR